MILKCEAVKMHLSTAEVWDEPLDLRSRRMFLEFRLTREEFEAAAAPFVQRVMRAVKRCLAKAPEGALPPEGVSDVILVGGSCEMPLLQREVATYFGKKPRKTLDHMEVVALGAAYQAEHAQETGRMVTVHSLATSLGVSCTGPDRFGVVRKNLFMPILEATSRLPARGTHEFFTMHGDQTEVLVAVYETEDETVEGLAPWDTRLVTGLPKAPAGTYPIQVTFDYSVEQTLTVKVEIPGTGIRDEWVAAFRKQLEGARATSQAKVERFRSSSMQAVAEFRDRVRGSLEPHQTEGRMGELLAALDGAIESGDLDAGMAAKRELGVLLFDEGFSLS